MRVISFGFTKVFSNLSGSELIHIITYACLASTVKDTFFERIRNIYSD